MRKFLFFLILLPAIIALGHDVYIFVQNPEKNFQLSDIGALWDKYHKESHDQWKIKLKEFGDTLDNVIPEELKTKEKAVYTEGFKQTDSRNTPSTIVPLKEDIPENNTNILQDYVGYILEQKAVFVFSGLALIVYLLNALITRLFGKKSDEREMRSLKRRRN